mmetsp:Transcript_47623/g.101197  ORF Transcript_47623/g.101197 Transcript_47623/m.101197 type:complete len:286 (+) Transcript_47623:119-976(+)
MKSVGVILAIVLTVVNWNLSNAWTGSLLAKLPRSSLRKSNNSACPLSVEGNLIDNGMEKLMRIRGGTSLEMSLETNPLVTSLAPRIGIITSTLLYFSPMNAVRVASRDKSLSDLNPIPLAIMAVSSLCWLVYGLSIRDPYVTLSNVPGCIASFWYIISLLPLLKGSQLQTTQNILVALSAITINLWTYLSLTNKSIVQVRSTLGLFASTLFIVLSGSPLSTIKTVLSTRNSASILASFTFAQVANTALWSAYGLAIKDRFVFGPNVVGLGFGLVQLMLTLTFPSH